MDLSDLQNWKLEEILYRVPDYFLPQEAEGVQMTAQFRLRGRESGTWCMHIADSRCWIEEGECMKADVSLTAESEDIRRILRGEVNPLQILLRGLVKVEGDKGAALKLGSFFRNPRE